MADATFTLISSVFLISALGCGIYGLCALLWGVKSVKVNISTPDTGIRHIPEYVESIRVVDGDTLAVKCAPGSFGLMENKKSEIYVRLQGIDAPEIGQAKSKQERMFGILAKGIVAHILSRARETIEIKRFTTDSYPNRIVGDVLIDGKSLSVALLNFELAGVKCPPVVRYEYGKQKRGEIWE